MKFFSRPPCIVHNPSVGCSARYACTRTCTHVARTDTHIHTCDGVVVAASITHPQNGLETMYGKSDNQMYYYPCSNQPLGQGLGGPLGPVSNLPNGSDHMVLSPPQNRHKRLKRTPMSSISSVEDEVESLGSETEVNVPPPTYYVKNSLGGSGGWPDERGPMDHG